MAISYKFLARAMLVVGRLPPVVILVTIVTIVTIVVIVTIVIVVIIVTVTTIDCFSSIIGHLSPESWISSWYFHGF